MALRKFSKSHHGTMNELNITPLLDLAFVLLVIFIIATAPSVNDLDLNLPAPNGNTNAPSSRPHLLIVEADGRLVFDAQTVPLRVLSTNLVQLRGREGTNATVVIFSESAALYQNMINVLDALQRADITRVGVAPERPTGPPATL